MDDGLCSRFSGRDFRQAVFTLTVPGQSRFAGIAADSRLLKWIAGSNLTLRRATLYLAIQH
jgi:hypothetical protein